MKAFPRIYSISTVGLMSHYNQDYLLHPIRTDFNGESGIGKSLIADFLQLIFVGKRGNKYYKPGTESSGSAGRGTHTLPVDSIGYAFINIEKSANRFITIGIYIQKNTGSITPFIVQKGISWDRNSTFEYHDKILLHQDFLTPDNSIAELEGLRKNVLKPKGFILEAFQPTDVSRYHNLLYHNQILPIDLSQDDDKLITYAQIIQSFARAKTLDTNVKEFKNFLFADDEEIYEEYKNQIRALEEYQRQYLENRKTINKVSIRFDVLKAYKNAVAEKENMFISHLTSQAAFDCQQHQAAKLEHKKNKTQYAENQAKVLQYYLSVGEFEETKLLSDLSELDRSKKEDEDELKSNTESLNRAKSELERVTGKSQELQERLFKATQINENLQQLDKLIHTYTTLDKIESAIVTQPFAQQNKQKLQNLISLLNASGDFDDFLLSYYYTLEFDESFEKSMNEIHTLTQEIQEYKTLIEAYTSKKNDSIITWVLNQSERTFTHAQESVLRHFIKLSTEKPTSGSEKRYIPAPDQLLNNLKIVTDGDEKFWINLGGVLEEVPFVLDKSFVGPRGINLETIVSSLREQVTTKTTARDKIVRLKETLQKANWSKELLALLRNRDSVLAFVEDTTLPTRGQFQEMKEWNGKRSQHQKDFDDTTKEWGIIRQSETEFKSIVFRCNEKKIELDRRINDRELKRAGNEKRLHSKRFDNDLYRQKINTVKSEFAGYFSSDNLNQVILDVSQSLKNYIQGVSIDSAKIFQEKITPLEKDNGALVERIKDLEDESYSFSLAALEQKYKKSKNNYYVETKNEFDPDKHPQKYTLDIVEKAEKSYNEADRKVKELHINQVEKLVPDNETVRSTFQLETIARELLPKVFEGKEIVSFEDNLESEVTGYLTSINESMRELDDHKLKLIQTIFNKVYNVYGEYDEKIKDIKQFFDEKEITGGLKVKIEFFPSKHYPIEWISSLKKQISSQSIKFTSLFKEEQDEELSAEEIIIRTFKQHADSKVKDPDIHKLTNPKSYFDIEVNLIRPSGEKSDGSSGQDYAKIALLCIARLSKIERDKRLRKVKNIPGIRFMPIDEVAGLGGNFDMLYQIAQEYDYQILTMTVSPDLVFEPEKQYVYILNGDKETSERKINMPPFGMFSSPNLQQDIAPFIKAQTNEKRINLESNR